MNIDRAANTSMKANWEFHKETIQRIYITQDKPLNHVMEYMQKSQGFSAR